MTASRHEVAIVHTAPGALVLKAVAVPEFVAAENGEYVELLKFIGE